MTKVQKVLKGMAEDWVYNKEEDGYNLTEASRDELADLNDSDMQTLENVSKRYGTDYTETYKQFVDYLVELTTK